MVVWQWGEQLESSWVWVVFIICFRPVSPGLAGVSLVVMCGMQRTGACPGASGQASAGRGLRGDWGPVGLGPRLVVVDGGEPS